jgi:hypothetical protein
MEAMTALVTGLLAAGFLAVGATKLAGGQPSLEIRDNLGVMARAWRSIGALEVADALALQAATA